MDQRDKTNQPRTKCAVYVTSWDGYSDLWKPFFALFWRYWPNCPYEVYVGANSKRFEDQKVSVVFATSQNNWSDRVAEHLQQIDSEYVLMLLEDWFLTRPVDTEAIASLVASLDVLDGHMIRLVPSAAPSFAVAGYPNIGMLAVGTLNRTNTHATIWRKTSLLSLIHAGESLWQFEVNGSIRSNMYSGGMFATWKTHMHYMGVVDRGKWTRAAARRFRPLDIGCDFDKRPIKSLREEAKWILGRWIAAISSKLLTHRIRQRLKLHLLGSSAYGKQR